MFYLVKLSMLMAVKESLSRSGEVWQRSGFMQETMLVSTLLFAGSPSPLSAGDLRQKLNEVQGRPFGKKIAVPWEQNDAQAEGYIKKLVKQGILSQTKDASQKPVFAIKEAVKEDVLATTLAVLAYVQTKNKTLTSFLGYAPERSIQILHYLQQAYDRQNSPDLVVSRATFEQFMPKMAVKRAIDVFNASGITFFLAGPTGPTAHGKGYPLTVSPEQKKELDSFLSAFTMQASDVTPEIRAQWAEQLLPPGEKVPDSLAKFAEKVCGNVSLMQTIFQRVRNKSTHSQWKGTKRPNDAAVIEFLRTHEEATSAEVGKNFGRSADVAGNVLRSLQHHQRVSRRRRNKRESNRWELSEEETQKYAALAAWEEIITRIAQERGGVAVVVYDHYFNKRNAFTEQLLTKPANVQNAHVYVGATREELFAQLSPQDQQLFLDAHGMTATEFPLNPEHTDALYHTLYEFDLRHFAIQAGSFGAELKYFEDASRRGRIMDYAHETKVLVQVANAAFKDAGISGSAFARIRHIVHQAKQGKQHYGTS